MHPPESLSPPCLVTPPSHLQTNPSLGSLKIFKLQPTFFFFFPSFFSLGKWTTLSPACWAEDYLGFAAACSPPGPAFTLWLPPTHSPASRPGFLPPLEHAPPPPVLPTLPLSPPPIHSKWGKLCRLESSLSWSQDGWGRQGGCEISQDAPSTWQALLASRSGPSRLAPNPLLLPSQPPPTQTRLHSSPHSHHP